MQSPAGNIRLARRPRRRWRGRIGSGEAPDVHVGVVELRFPVLIPLAPLATLFPYTTLFRSRGDVDGHGGALSWRQVSGQREALIGERCVVSAVGEVHAQEIGREHV